MASVLQILALGAVNPAAPLASTPAPLYWRQTLFSIPFHVQRPQQASEEAAQVQLYVSPDRGVRWDNWRQAPPQKGYFLFRAGIDGEYWFDVRTLDRAGRLRPQGPHAPKLIVIVDTLPPKVQLTARRGESGQITADFRIDELHPKLDSLAIDYRLAPDAPWQAVAVGPGVIRGNGAERSGEVSFHPQSASGVMEIRLRISDLAGNPAESHAQLNLAAAATPPSTMDIVATGSPSQPANGSPGTTMTVKSTNGGSGWQSLGPQTSRTPWPAENAGGAASSLTALPVKESGAVAARVNPPVTHQFVAVQERPAQSAPSNGFNSFTAAQPAGAAVPPAAAPAASAAPAAIGPPPGEKLRWINSRAFQLTYDTRILGSVGPVPVELWGTRDGGQTWQSYGVDPKGQSPMLVTVPAEGVYGFQMMLQSGSPTAGRPPLSGEAPRTWIGIDLTRPVGRITQAQQGTGRDADKLFVSWEASDDRKLADKPISLSYSDRPGGPWTAIVANHENAGRYAWQLNGALPQRVYLRLEARDAAGNMGVFESPQPVALDLSAPAAHVHDLRPLSWTTDTRAGVGRQEFLR